MGSAADLKRSCCQESAIRAQSGSATLMMCASCLHRMQPTDASAQPILPAPPVFFSPLEALHRVQRSRGDCAAARRLREARSQAHTALLNTRARARGAR
jgi:hypothetical protein